MQVILAAGSVHVMVHIMIQLGEFAKVLHQKTYQCL